MCGWQGELIGGQPAGWNGVEEGAGGDEAPSPLLILSKRGRPASSGKGMLRSFFPRLLPATYAGFHRPPCRMGHAMNNG